MVDHYSFQQDLWLIILARFIRYSNEFDDKEIGKSRSKYQGYRVKYRGYIAKYKKKMIYYYNIIFITNYHIICYDI